MMTDEEFLRHCVRRKWDGETESIKIDVGPSSVVEIDKMFGPLIACGVRVRLDVSAGAWVVERECIRRKHEVPQAIPGVDGGLSYGEGPAMFWEEVTRFDCQDSIDFDEDA